MSDEMSALCYRFSDLEKKKRKTLESSYLDTLGQSDSVSSLENLALKCSAIRGCCWAFVLASASKVATPDPPIKLTIPSQKHPMIDQ